MSDDDVVARPRRVTQKPDHYAVVCISMYTDDRKATLAKIEALKDRGFTQMNLSRLIRIAVDRLDIDDLERDLRAAGVKR
jgi:hypothetical protein